MDLKRKKNLTRVRSPVGWWSLKKYHCCLVLLASFGSLFFLVLFVFPRFFQRFLTCFLRITCVDQTNFLISQAFVFDPGFQEHSLHLGRTTTDELSYFLDLVFSSVENQYFVTRFPLGFSTWIPRNIGHTHPS